MNEETHPSADDAPIDSPVDSDWQTVAKHINGAVQATQPYVGAIAALKAETPKKAPQKRLQQVVDAIQNKSSVDEVFDNGWNMDPLQTEVLTWHLESKKHKADVDSGSLASIGMTSNDRFVSGIITYQLLVFSFLLLFGLIMHRIITPVFAEIFDSFQMPLPPPTRIVLRSFPYLVAALIACLALLFVWWFRRSLISERLRRSVGFNVPITGHVFRSESFANLCCMASNLIRIGTPVGPAIRVSARSTLPYSWISGVNLLDQNDLFPLATTNHYPHRLARLLQSESNPVALARDVQELGCDYRSRARGRIKRYFEPVVIILVGIFVGFAVISMLSPLVSLITNLSG